MPLSSIGGIGFFEQQAQRIGGMTMPRKDAKHLDRFHSIMESTVETTTRLAEEAALMTEPLATATTRFLMDRVGDTHHQLLNKTIGEMKAENAKDFGDEGNEEKKNGLPGLAVTQSQLEDVWGDNAPAIQAASEQFQKDLRAAKQPYKANAEKEEQLSSFANASLGLTAPLDLLKDDELKQREEEITVEDERAERRARIAQDQAELRELMKHIQHASMEKKQRAKDAREKGSFPVILAALAESDSEELKKPEPTAFDRVASARSSGHAIGSKEELSFEQLNKQIRMKYEQEKIEEKAASEKIVVVKKLERNNQLGLGRAALRLIKRSLDPFRGALSKQP